MNQLELFYNTINLDGADLKEAQIKAGTQNAIVLKYFKERPSREYTPWDVAQNCSELWDVPITSIRRSLSTLTDLGYLEKTEHMRQGIYGKSNFCWRLKKFM